MSINFSELVRLTFTARAKPCYCCAGTYLRYQSLIVKNAIDTHIFYKQGSVEYCLQ